MAKKRYTIDGISVEIDERVFSDFEVAELQIKLNREMPKQGEAGFEKAVQEQGRDALKFIDLILGKEKDHVLQELKKKNDGFASVEDVYT